MQNKGSVMGCVVQEATDMGVNRSMQNKMLTELAPRPEAALEWWFLNGRLCGPGLAPARLMFTLFRQRTTGKDAKAAHTLIWSRFDEQTLEHQTGCLIEPSTADLLVSLSPKILKTAGDRHILESYVEMVRQQGPPHPVRMASAAPIWNSSGLEMAWDGFELKQNSEGVKFRLPGWDGIPALSLQTSPLTTALDISYSKKVQNHIGTMCYECWPRLSLTGPCDGHLLDGSAWLDHQWGDYDWFFFKQEGAVVPLGWMWFGINLESGHDLVAIVHWNTVDNKPIACHATLARNGTIEKQSEDFRVHSLDKWRSPRTWIEYPLKWWLEIPDFDFQALIDPLACDQEVPVFGPARAIWEGAARIKGRLGERDVQGWARCELYGNGFSQGIDKLAAYFGTKVDGHIKSFLPERIEGDFQSKLLGTLKWEYGAPDYEAVLGAPAWEIMSRGGKRWRPLFGMLLLESLGESSVRYEDLIALFGEFPHIGSLVIDDIQDNSLLRRNAPCLHRIYGIGPSINIGNLLYFMPFELLSHHPGLTAAQRLETFQIITRQFINAHMGQGMDLRASHGLIPKRLCGSSLDRLEQTLLNIYRQKTGSLLQGLALVASVIAKTDGRIRSACARFAGDMGIVFQVSDDILNYSTSSHWTKTPCEDIAEGKITFVLIQALRSLDPREVSELAEIINQPERQVQEKDQQRALDLVYASGALESSRLWCEKRFKALWRQLDPVLSPSIPKVLLKGLCQKLLERDN